MGSFCVCLDVSVPLRQIFIFLIKCCVYCCLFQSCSFGGFCVFGNIVLLYYIFEFILLLFHIFLYLFFTIDASIKHKVIMYMVIFICNYSIYSICFNMANQ